MRACALLLVIIGALTLTAEVVVAPASPTAADVLSATIEVPAGCAVTHSTSVAGTSVRTEVTITGCAIGPPPFPVSYTVVFGPLSAGTYTYEVYSQYETDPPVLEGTVTLMILPAIAPAAIPTLGQIALVLLGISVAGIALRMLQR